MAESGENERERERRLITLTEEVLGCPPEERDALVQKRCQGDERLLASVHQILARYHAEETLEVGHVDGVTLSSATTNGEGPSAWGSFLDQLRSRGPLYTRYVVSGELARGGMGVIHRVFDQDARRPLAMKVILENGEPPSGRASTIDDRMLGRFLEEAQITSQLDHPGIVPVHDIGVDGQGRVYFTMKLVKGEDLRSVMDRVNDENDDTWTLPRAVNVILRVTEAMSYAHAKGVVHRDLKPANVMVGRFGEVFVMDWGLARLVDRTDEKDLRIREKPDATATVMQSDRRDTSKPDDLLLTMDGDVVGTPAYMPPEQAAGRLAEVGPASDIYAVGAMMYHLLAGHVPYVPPGTRISNRTVLARVQEGPPAPIEERAQNTPPELASICRKAMARDPLRRYSSMDGFGEDLRAFLEHRVVQAHRTGLLARGRACLHRHPGVSLVSLAALVALALTAGVAWRQVRAEQRQTAARNYTAHITAAAWHVEKHNSIGARQHLEACDQEFRGFEWDHLRLATDSSIAVFPLPDGFSFEGHGGYSTPLALHPDGALVAFGLNNGEVLLLRRETGEQVERFQCGAGVVDLAFEPDGRYLAIASSEQVLLKDLATGEMKVVSSDATRSVAVARGGDPLFWSSSVGEGSDLAFEVREFSSRGERKIARIKGESELTLQTNRDGTQLLIESLFGRKAWLWNGGESLEIVGVMPPAVLAAGEAGVFGVRPDTGGAALVAMEEGWPVTWSVPVSEPRYFLATPLLAPDGWEQLFIADGSVLRRLTRSFSSSEREPAEEVMLGHTGRIRNLVVSQDGRWVITTSEDQTWRIWGGSGPLHRARPPHVQSIEGTLEMDPDGKAFWTHALNGILTRWDVAGAYRSDIERAKYHEEERRYVQQVKGEGPRSERFLLSRWPMLRHVRAGSSYEILAVDHRRPPLAFHPTEEMVAAVSSSDDEPAVLRIYRKGNPTPEIERALGVTDVRSIAFIDKRRLAVSTGDGPALVFDIEDPTGTPSPLGEATTGTTLLRSSTDGVWIGGIAEDVVWIAKCSNPTLLIRLPHAQQPTAIAFSSQGRIATGTSAGSIYLWDPVTATNVGILDGQTEVQSLCFTLDGKTLISSGDRVVFWESDRTTALRRSEVQSALPSLQSWVMQEFEETVFAEDVRAAALRESRLGHLAEVAGSMAVVANWLDAADEGYPAPFNLFGMDSAVEAARQVLLSADHPDEEYRAAARALARAHRRFPALPIKVSLALAQYRLDRFDISAPHLASAHGRDQSDDPIPWKGADMEDYSSTSAVCMVVEAMTYFRQGEVEKAREILATVDYGDRDGTGNDLIDEAIRLIQP